MPGGFNPRRDPQDPTVPGGGYPGGSAEGAPMGPVWGWGFDPNKGERPRRPRPSPPRAPSTFPPQNEADACLAAQRSIVCAIQDPYVKDAIGKLVEETFRSFILPTSPPPWVVPPFNSQPLGGSGTGVVAAGGAYTTLVTGYVPRGRWGILRWLGQDTVNVAAGTGVSAWDSLVWDVAIAPGTTTAPTGTFVSIPSYTDWVEQRGQIEAPCECYLFIPEGHWFRLRSRVSAGGPFTVAGLAIGWTWLIRGGRLDGSAKGVMGD